MHVLYDILCSGIGCFCATALHEYSRAVRRRRRLIKAERSARPGVVAIPLLGRVS